MTKLNNIPQKRDFDTLNRLESLRSIKETLFQPEWIKEYKNIRYLKQKQLAKNKSVDSNLFDEIIKIKQIGKVIHAIGLIGSEQVVLTMEM